MGTQKTPRILVTALSWLVGILTVFCGFVVVMHVLSMHASVPGSAPGADQKPAFSFDLSSLSRLSLFPRKPRSHQMVAIMVENHEDARTHHRGLEDAEAVYEFFVEGFISRFMVLYKADELPPSVGPVRSLRPYFLDNVLPLKPVVFHIGGSPEALDMVEKYNLLPAFNGIYYDDNYFKREAGIPAPHDAFLTNADITAMLEEVTDGETALWPPYKTGRSQAGSGATSIDVQFYNPLHNVSYVYDSKKRHYIRTNGADISLLTPRNVLLLSMATKEVGPFGRLAIETAGEGELLLFRNGRVFPGTWSRETVDDPYVYRDESGAELVFASGPVWVTAVDDMGRVEWTVEE